MIVTQEKPAPLTSRECCVSQDVAQRIASCSYSFYFNRVRHKFAEGRLVLLGSVPTFHLKQMLQELLRGIEYVDRIENRVDVVSSVGLSSVRSNERKKRSQ